MHVTSEQWTPFNVTKHNPQEIQVLCTICQSVQFQKGHTICICAHTELGLGLWLWLELSTIVHAQIRNCAD